MPTSTLMLISRFILSMGFEMFMCNLVLVKKKIPSYWVLEGVACYASLLLASAEGIGLRPRLFFCSKGKKEALALDFHTILAQTLVIFGDQ